MTVNTIPFGFLLRRISTLAAARRCWASAIPECRSSVVAQPSLPARLETRCDGLAFQGLGQLWLRQLRQLRSSNAVHFADATSCPLFQHLLSGLRRTGQTLLLSALLPPLTSGSLDAQRWSTGGIAGLRS